MIGANLSYALASIPHLGELLTSDLQAVIDAAETVVVSHRLKPEKWKPVRWRTGQRVIDLVNIAELRAAPNYEGLYW
jgi:GDP-mannose 6-dehydrogenase